MGALFLPSNDWADKVRTLIAAFLALVAAALTVGCGQKVEPWGAVSGTILLDGKPVFPASVLFSDQERGVEVTAETDASGQFVVRTDKIAGLPVGTYLVAVVPLRAAVLPQQGMVFDQSAAMPQLEIPQEVQELATTRLSAVVKEGENRFRFDLGQFRQ